MFRESSFEESSGIDSGGGMTLDVHQIRSPSVVSAAEEVIEAYLI
jgi:hypothetical protein